MSDGVMTYEDWLRGCVHHDGRNGYVTLPCDEVLKIADFIERLRNSECIPIEYIKDQIEEYRKFDHLGMYAEFLDMFIQDYKDNAMANYADRKTKPMETTDYCKKCNHKGCETCAADGSNPYCVPSRYEPKKKSCADCEYHDWEVDEHIGFRSVCNGIGKCPNKTEPQYHADVECNYKDCDNCGHKGYCPQREPQTEKPSFTATDFGKGTITRYIDEPQTCNNCDLERCETCVTEIGKDEPQTERSRE